VSPLATGEQEAWSKPPAPSLSNATSPAGALPGPASASDTVAVQDTGTPSIGELSEHDTAVAVDRRVTERDSLPLLASCDPSPANRAVIVCDPDPAPVGV
jgi:hypothetical protein